MGSDLKEFWQQLDMPALRAETKRAIDQDLSIGILSRWEDVESLILPFPRGDVNLEGEELEPALVPGEKPYGDESEEESEPSGDEHEVCATALGAAAATPAADAPLPDQSLTAIAPSPAADPSPTASGEKESQLEAKLG